MKEAVEALIKARTEMKIAQDAMEVLRNAWTILAAAKMLEMESAKIALGEAEEAARQAGLAYYKEHPGSKKLPYGLGIQSRSWMTYKPEDALEWAKTHNIGLALNKTVFEATAQALADRNEALSFVTTGKTDIATLPKEIKMEVEGESEAT